MKGSSRQYGSHFQTAKLAPDSDYSRASRAYEVSNDLSKEIFLPHVQKAANSVSQQAEENPKHEIIKIASVPLCQYKPEEISLEVDNEKVALHGLHRFEREDRFLTSEFKRCLKLPDGVDPTTVTSRITQNGGVLVIEGMKCLETRAKDRRFEAKMDFRGLKPEEIKIQRRRNELTVTEKRLPGDHPSRDYSRRILLPDDVDLGSVMSHLSKEGLLSIETPSIQQKAFKVTMETSEPCEEPSMAELFALVV